MRTLLRSAGWGVGLLGIALTALAVYGWTLASQGAIEPGRVMWVGHVHVMIAMAGLTSFVAGLMAGTE